METKKEKVENSKRDLRRGRCKGREKTFEQNKRKKKIEEYV